MKHFASLCLCLCALLALPLMTGAYELSGQAGFMPWSGYWWPQSKGELVQGYRSRPSPIEKYEYFAMGMYPAQISAWAKDPSNGIYSPGALDWEGLCHAWANAAVLEDIDFEASSYDGIYWNVGDKKGLVTLAHKDDPKLEVHSVKNDPHLFHLMLLDYLGDQGVGIVGDLDSSLAVWSHPIYRFEMTVTPGGSSDSVECTIHYASDLGISPDFVGTVLRTKDYRYVLNKDAQGNYVDGYWIASGSNLNEKIPDKVWVPASQHVDCPSLDYDLVREIALSESDPWPGGSVVTGAYQYIVMPGPSSTVEGAIEVPLQVPTGVRRLSLWLARDLQSSGGYAYYSLTRSGETVIDTTKLTTVLSKVTLADPEPGDYVLRLSDQTMNFYTGPACVQLYLDLDYEEKTSLFARVDDFSWLGLALGNRDQGQTTPFQVTLVADNGLPLWGAEIDGPLEGDALWSGVVPMTARADLFSGGSPLYVKVSSQNELCAVQLKGTESLLVASPACRATPGSTWAVPVCTSQYESDSRADLFLANPGSDAASYTFTTWPDAGSGTSGAMQFTSGGGSHDGPGDYFGSKELRGWALIQGSPGTLVGSVELSESDLRADSVPLLEPGRDFVLPHAGADGYWETWLGLINTSQEAADITLTFVNGDTSLDYTLSLGAHTRQEVLVHAGLWGITHEEINAGFVRVSSSQDIAGWCSYRGGASSLASIPLTRSQDLTSVKRIGLVASDEYWWTGMALVNPGDTDADVTIVGYQLDGLETARQTITLAAGEKVVTTLPQIFTEISGPVQSLRIASPQPLSCLILYGGSLVDALLTPCQF